MTEPFAIFLYVILQLIPQDATECTVYTDDMQKPTFVMTYIKDNHWKWSLGESSTTRFAAPKGKGKLYYQASNNQLPRVIDLAKNLDKIDIDTAQTFQYTYEKKRVFIIKRQTNFIDLVNLTDSTKLHIVWKQ